MLNLSRVFRNLVLLLLFAALTAFPVISQAAGVPSDQRKILLDPGRTFTAISSVENLPKEILQLITGAGGKLAEPGGDWEPTDVITDANLPNRRLIWAVSDGEYYVLHYERGGRGHSYHFLIAQMKEGQASALWWGIGEPEEGYTEFIQDLDTDAVKDGANFGH